MFTIDTFNLGSHLGEKSGLASPPAIDHISLAVLYPCHLQYMRGGFRGGRAGLAVRLLGDAFDRGFGMACFFV